MIRFAATKACIFFCLLLIALGMTVAFGENGERGSELSEKAAAARARIVAAEDRWALEAYDKRNAQIAPWAEDSAPTGTDNAALLYYQAFLLRPELNEAMKYEIRPGTEPTRSVSENLNLSG